MRLNPTVLLPRRLGTMLVAALVLALTACESPPSQQQSGTVIGGLLGGVLGSQVGQGSGRTAATVIGTLIGASIGGNVGRSMDQTDRLRTAQALETVSTGRSSSWRNPDTGAQCAVHRHPHPYAPDGRRPLSRIHRGRHRRRTTGAGLRPGLSAAGRKLARRALNRPAPAPFQPHKDLS